MLTHVTTNTANSPIRHATLQGRKYLVAPMAMITAGVHNGSNGALLYEEADIEKSVRAWNMKPIVVYHPQINNQGVSAADPDVLEKQQVGMVMNTTYSSGKLRAEAWIEIALAANVDDRVLDALENNKVMEVSTGLFTSNDPGEGTWNDANGKTKDYVAIARNHQPDHLALLPDQIGACSVADGAGLLVANAEDAGFEGADVMDVARRIVGNKLSYSNLQSQLHKKIQERIPHKKKVDGDVVAPWVVDVYDSFFIYEMDGTLYRLNYTNGKGGVEITGDADEVVRVTEYRTATNGKFVGNARSTNNTKKTMKKEELVDGLIANTDTQWDQADKETLMGLEESTLNKMAPPYKKKGKDDEDEDEDGKKPTKNEAAPQPEATAPATLSGNALEDYINAAPPAVQQVLRGGLEAHQKEQGDLIAKITANAANIYTPEGLATKGLADLRAIAALAAPVANAEPRPANVAMFVGAAGVSGPTANQSQAEAPLEVPTMNFGSEKNG